MPHRGIRVRDRKTGELFDERVFAEGSLRFLYGNPLGRLVAGGLLKRRWVSRLYGHLQAAPQSRRRILPFVMRLDIDPEEAELPLDAYPTLDAFFTRRLRAGARPIDPDPEHLISPADGRLLVYRDVGSETFRVKRSVVSLPLLAGSEAAARPFVGGTVFVVRLAPGDYHRFHFPDSGSTPRATRLGSTLHSVHTIALDYGAPAFRNRRDLTPFSSEHFGPLLLIEIGALFVGSIVQTCEPGRVRRGAEKGYFHFGGSTVVVVAAPGSLRPDEDLVASSAAGVETLVQMGTAIASRV